MLPIETKYDAVFAIQFLREHTDQLSQLGISPGYIVTLVDMADNIIDEVKDISSLEYIATIFVRKISDYLERPHLDVKGYVHDIMDLCETDDLDEYRILAIWSVVAEVLSTCFWRLYHE